MFLLFSSYRSGCDSDERIKRAVSALRVGCWSSPLLLWLSDETSVSLLLMPLEGGERKPRCRWKWEGMERRKWRITVGVKDLQEQDSESVLLKMCLAETESFLPPPCWIAQQQQYDWFQRFGVLVTFNWTFNEFKLEVNLSLRVFFHSTPLLNAGSESSLTVPLLWWTLSLIWPHD